MMVDTCPGKMSASSFSEGSLMMTSSAPGMFLWAPYTVKFARSMARARLMAIATSGVVVSKPTPTKTICRSGFSWRQTQGVQRRVNDLHRAPRRLLGQQAGRGAGHAGHIAEGGDGHFRHTGQRDYLVDVVVARHAHRTSRARRQMNPLGHKAANAVARNGHGVGARTLPSA